MKKNNQSIYFILIVIVLFGITVGYAAINRTLSITGNSEVVKNTWDIHFENINVKRGSVVASKTPTIENSNLTVDFSAILNLPGDFYEFTVDVVNSGTIDAMIDSIVKTPELSEEQKKYINYIIEYQNKEQVNSKQLITAGEFIRLKVRIEYKNNITENDLPSKEQNLSLGFTLNYVQSDTNTAVAVKDNGVFEIIAEGPLDEIGTIVTIGSEQFYTIGTEGNNVKLLSMYNLHVGNSVDENFNVTQIQNPTGMQSETAKGFVDGKFPYVGTTAFSNTNSSYSGSIVEGYINNYKTEIEKMGATVVEARPITKDELISEKIGCTEADKKCTVAPSFIYQTSYWANPTESSDTVWIVLSGGTFGPFSYSSDVSFGVRPVIVISKNDIKVKPVANGNIEDIGTIVKIDTEKFYTIGTEGDNVKLLSMYNLYVGNECSTYNSESCVPYGEEATGMQDENMRGYNTIEGTRRGATIFSQLNTTYAGSSIETHVNKYKDEIEKIGPSVVEARLISLEELKNEKIGCSDTDKTCLNAPNFIYETSYWTETSASDKTIWAVFGNGELDSRSFDYDFSFGVRPVIVIPKSLF